MPTAPPPNGCTTDNDNDSRPPTSTRRLSTTSTTTREQQTGAYHPCMVMRHDQCPPSSLPLEWRLPQLANDNELRMPTCHVATVGDVATKWRTTRTMTLSSFVVLRSCLYYHGEHPPLSHTTSLTTTTPRHTVTSPPYNDHITTTPEQSNTIVKTKTDDDHDERTPLPLNPWLSRAASTHPHHLPPLMTMARSNTLTTTRLITQQWHAQTYQQWHRNAPSQWRRACQVPRRPLQSPTDYWILVMQTPYVLHD